MDNNLQTVLDKGVYTHLENSKFVKLKQFVIVGEEDKRYLLLRFVNESEIVVTGIVAVITQIKANGAEGKSTEVRFKGFKANPGDAFSPQSGILISDDCAEFIIRIKQIISDNYVYCEVGGKLRAKYNPPSVTKHLDQSKSRFSAKQKKVSLCKLSALVAVIGLAAFVALSVYLSARLLGSFGSPSAALASLRWF